MDDSPPSAPRASVESPLLRRETRPSPWRVPLIVFGVLAGVVAVLVFLVFVFIQLAQEEPVTEKDKDVLVTAAHFAVWLEGFEVDPALETFTKIRNIDRSYELDYEYDGEDLYISCSIGVDRSAIDARGSYVGLTAGASIGASLSEAEWRERPELMRWGDQSKCALLYVDGGDEPSGNLFACRKGKRTLLLIFSGVFFDEAESFREFLEPVLTKFDRYNP